MRSWELGLQHSLFLRGGGHSLTHNKGKIEENGQGVGGPEAGSQESKPYGWEWPENF